MSKQTKKIFVILSLVMVFSIAMASLGIAYAGGVRGIGLLGLSFFFTVGIVIVLAQAIPASILFCLMISSVFSTFRRNEMPIRAT